MKNAEAFGLPFTPTASDFFVTIEDDKFFTMASYCYKKCSSTDFLEIIGPTNLYKRFANNQIKTPITEIILI